MRYLALSLCFFSFIGNAVADYTVKSDYLNNPKKNIDLVVQNAEFWKNARDDVNGGFYSYVDEKGFPTYPEEDWWFTEQCGVVFDYHLKSVVGQSTLAYAFSRAFMLTGNLTYLEHAQHALDFMYEYGWDDENDGWFFTFDQAGNLITGAIDFLGDIRTIRLGRDRFIQLDCKQLFVHVGAIGDFLGQLILVFLELNIRKVLRRTNFRKFLLHLFVDKHLGQRIGDLFGARRVG